MSKTPVNQIFITIAKEQRGSLLEEEINQSINAIKKVLKDYVHLFIIKEYRDRYARDFIHLHAYAQIPRARAPEALKRSFIPLSSPCKHLPFYEHPKDVDIQPVTDVKQLIGGYFTKSSDYEILENTFDNEYIEECKNHVKETQCRFKTNLIKNHRQSTQGEIHYLFMQFILDNNFNYDCTTKSFIELYIAMCKTQKYVLSPHFKNIKSIKLHLDVLMDNSTYMEKYLYKVFEDIDLELQNKF